MAYVSPAYEDFVAVYPEFFGVIPSERFDSLLPFAESEVGDTWIESDRIPAIFALIAHWFFSASLLSGGIGVTGGATSGPIVSETVGPLSVSYRNTQIPLRTSSSGSSYLDSTPYGLLFENLRMRSFPAVAIV